MAKKKNPAASPPIDLDLRFRASDEPFDPLAKRFDIFLIDTGWNSAISKAVRSHLPLMLDLAREDTFYVLSSEQSVELLKRAPRLIGHDPIILVYDLRPPVGRKARGYRGFRLNLGLMKHPEQALARLQEFVRFIAVNRASVRLDQSVRRELYREGLDGMVKILREATTELL